MNMILIRSVEKIADGLRELLIGNVRGFDAGLQLEHLADEMSRRAETAGGKRELVRLSLEQGHKLGDRLGRDSGIGDQNVV